MKGITQYFTIFLSLAVVVLASGCGKDNSVTSSSLQKSGVLAMKATAKLNPNAGVNDIPVPGGSLHFRSALLNIGSFRIEENTGFEGEEEGEHEDSDVTSPATEDDENGREAQDILVTGPFSFDITAGEAFIDSVAVYPGTFKNVDMTFMINTDPPFNGKTIVISGEFTPTNRSAIPFTLKSETAKMIRTRIAGNGITVAENTTVPAVVVFDLAGLFSNANFAGAHEINGEIVLDNTSNTALLTAFESNLSRNVEMEDDIREEEEDED